MNLQYITDNNGTTQGVFIPISDWETLKVKYNVPEEERIDKNVNFPIPEEHIQLVRERTEKYGNRPESYISWEELESKINFEVSRPMNEHELITDNEKTF